MEASVKVDKVDAVPLAKEFEPQPQTIITIKIMGIRTISINAHQYIDGDSV